MTREIRGVDGRVRASAEIAWHMSTVGRQRIPAGTRYLGDEIGREKYNGANSGTVERRLQERRNNRKEI
jgi:hypothetical protein